MTPLLWPTSGVKWSSADKGKEEYRQSFWQFASYNNAPLMWRGTPFWLRSSVMPIEWYLCKDLYIQLHVIIMTGLHVMARDKSKAKSRLKLTHASHLPIGRPTMDWCIGQYNRSGNQQKSSHVSYWTLDHATLKAQSKPYMNACTMQYKPCLGPSNWLARFGLLQKSIYYIAGRSDGQQIKVLRLALHYCARLQHNQQGKIEINARSKPFSLITRVATALQSPAHGKIEAFVGAAASCLTCQICVAADDNEGRHPYISLQPWVGHKTVISDWNCLSIM